MVKIFMSSLLMECIATLKIHCCTEIPLNKIQSQKRKNTEMKL